MVSLTCLRIPRIKKKSYYRTPRLSSSPKIHPLREKKNSKIKYFEKYWNFILSPRSHFVYETVLTKSWNFVFKLKIKFFILFRKAFFLIFLMIFSYLMLCEFRFYVNTKNKKNVFTNSTAASLTDLLANNKTLSTLPAPKSISNPNWIEYVVIFWVFSFACQEIFQVLKFYIF